ncbi:MAG: serine hydrolase [Pyrinomonadaceae bacterium]|nr:serine hydrolase [Pyrinomonadaceae bacterium]
MKNIQIRFLYALLLFGILVCGPTHHLSARTPAQAEFAEKIAKIEEFVQAQMKRDGITGLTIGFQSGDFRWVKGFGMADIENKIPTKPQSSYRMASVTKPMTAVGILLLVEQGKIALDAEVQKYVPYFPKKKYPVTIRQLLGHIGGISHYRNYDLEGHFKEHKNTREAIRVFEKFDLVNEPGTRYSYTSYGFNLLGAAIEGASGKSYGEYMTENVWKPLGMNSTVLDNPVKIIPNRVRGYRLINGKLANSEFVDISSRFAAGGIRSTVPDMLNFAKGMYEGKLLTAKMRTDMWTSQTTKNGYGTGYGYGWRTNAPNGRFMVGHSGSQAETKTYLMAIPNERFAAAVAINFENSNPGIYPAEVFKILFGEPWQIRYYSNKRSDQITLAGMDLAFDEGMRHYAQHGTALAKSEEELSGAFSYFDRVLNSPVEDMAGKLRAGIHPAQNRVLTKMVSYIADKLKNNGKNLDNYYKNGVIVMFNDYIDWYRSQPDYSSGLKFNSAFEQKVARWKNDWAQVWNRNTQNFEIHDADDAASMSEKLKSTFSGKSVYPNYVNDLNDSVTKLATSGKLKSASKVAQINYELYPQSSTTNATMGILNVLDGQDENALAAFKRSLKLNPRGNANARSLNAVAYDLKSINKPKAGLRLLLIAVRLHPKEANLYDSIGEFYLNMKQIEKGVEFYKKALAVDPNYPNAQAARDLISKQDK